jgi:predicted alpha/beta superfamily hydrolase
VKGSEVHVLHSSINQTDYLLYIKLPPGYRDSVPASYPTVYMLDGDDVFGMAAGITDLLQAGEEIPEVILVGIGYGAGMGQPGNRRTRDFLPTFVPERKTSGGGLDFLKVVNEEIVPYIDTRFRTSRSTDRTLWGGSAGGLFAFTALFKQPGLFSNFIINSPVFYSDTVLFSYERTYAVTHSDLPVKLYTTVGSLEEKDRFITPWNQLTQSLQGRPYKSLKIEATVLPDESHVSAPARTFSSGLRFVFSHN